MITEALKKEIWEHRLEDLKELRDLLNMVIREKEKTVDYLLKCMGVKNTSRNLKQKE